MSADAGAGAGAVHRAEAFVLGWARRYTRGLPEDVAARRVDELASDVWEQRHRARVVGAHPVAVATSLVARTVAGLPADLAWRHQARTVHRSRTLDGGGRPMGRTEKRPLGRRIKDNWWVVLGGVNAAMAVVLGVGLPFEDRTLGSVFGGIAIAALGIVGVVGVFLRRRPGRRATGDVMVVLGQLPWLPFLWTIVFPIVSLAVILAALTDSADASARVSFGPPSDGARTGEGARPPEVGAADATRADAGSSDSDRALAVLVIALVAAVAAAVVIGEPAAAYTIVAPAFGFVVGHLVFRRRLADRRLLHVGAVVATGAAMILAPLPVALMGGALLVAGVLGGRRHRPA